MCYLAIFFRKHTHLLTYIFFELTPTNVDKFYNDLLLLFSTKLSLWVKIISNKKQDEIVLNKYPLWKSLLVLFIVLIGALYALPNIYGEDPAVQMSGKRSVEVTSTTLSEVRDLLTSDNLNTLSLEIEKDQILARFKDTETQLRARDLLEEVMGDKYSVAIEFKTSNT